MCLKTKCIKADVTVWLAFKNAYEFFLHLYAMVCENFIEISAVEKITHIQW